MDELVGYSSGAASSALAVLRQATIEQNRSFEAAAQEIGIDLPRYRAFPAAPALCFFHIPKTAGGAIGNWIRSMFDEDEVAPYRTHAEFNQLPLDSKKYQLYAGHISGRLLRHLPRKTQLVTINRDPVERCISEFYWVRDALPPENAKLFENMEFDAALAMDTPATRHVFRERILHQFAALHGEDDKSELPNDSPLLYQLRDRQFRRAYQLLRHFAVVGDYAEVEEAALLIAAIRGWPPPPPLPRIHDLGAPTVAMAADIAIRGQVWATNPGDFRLYELTRQMAKSIPTQLKELCGAATAKAVDRHHVQQYFATAPRVIGFDIGPEAPHNGTGWLMARREGNGLRFRPMTGKRPVSTLALLDPSIGDYQFFCHVFHSTSPMIRDSLRVTVADMPLQRTQMAWHQWADLNALVLEWTLPQSLVAQLDGKIEFVLEADVPSDGTLWLGRIGCVPAQPAK
jgi:hypothetical protein